jgi:hypothetical protein
MTTRLYLRNQLSTVIGRPSSSEATGETDRGSVGVNRFFALQALATKGAAQHEEEWFESAHPSGDWDSLVRIWLSSAIQRQATLEAGCVFTVAAAIRGNSVENPGFGEARFFIYLWRPGVGYVATLSAAAANARTATWTVTRTYDALETFFVVACPALGADIEAYPSDRIVVEAYFHFHVDEAGGSGDNYYRMYWDGMDDGKTTGQAVADAASYVECSQTLELEATMDDKNILVGARDVEVDDVNLGALDGGVEHRHTRTLIEHEVDQRLGIVGADVISERHEVTLHCKEATLENLRIAMAQPASALSLSTLSFGSNRTVSEHVVNLFGKAPGTGKTRKVHLNRAVVINSGSHSYLRGAATILDMTFLCLEDLTQAEGFTFGYFEDEDGVFAFA